ncbi:MAG TPA: hypothetical protein VMY42_27375 [Thermoguttaceae bacterium]|nr:hypothetical protein [Thermoguttaceae bacterium]
MCCRPWKTRRVLAAVLVICVVAAVPTSVAEDKPAAVPSVPYAAWENGPGTDADFFPIAVWLQAPRNAPKYQAIGINLYVGLWKGPTQEQLAELKKHGMPVICSQNDYARGHLDEKIIVGWMHGDEPDNAQSLGPGKGYGPPIPPETMIADYRRIKVNDPTRPVLLNLGQGVAWDGWHGRGVRTNHPEDYPQYAQGCDVASFDIYPAVHGKPEIAGQLWYVARGVERLRQWTAGRKVVWNCIECTRISNPNVKPTPQEVEAEVWMSIVHGSQGLIYFCHQFQPTFIEAGLLADPQMAEAVGRINRQIHSLAPVINGPTIERGATAEPTLGSRIECLVKRTDEAIYVFAVNMERKPEKPEITVRGAKDGTAEVLFEDRTVAVHNGRIVDQFAPYGVHRYKITR